jgi:hypothetical protein
MPFEVSFDASSSAPALTCPDLGCRSSRLFGKTLEGPISEEKNAYKEKKSLRKRPRGILVHKLEISHKKKKTELI